MSPTVRCVTIDCTGDPYELGRFWSDLLGRQLADDDQPGDPEALIAGGGGVPTLLFVRVSEGKTVKNRMHLDLQPRDRSRDEGGDRVLGLGARLLEDRRETSGAGWVVLADPGANEFCVLPSEAEYEALGRRS